jgi:hypothetical protein
VRWATGRLAIQHDSSVVLTHLEPGAAGAPRSIDAALRDHPARSRPPAPRRPIRPHQVHGAARGVSDRWHVRVRAQGGQGIAAPDLTYVVATAGGLPAHRPGGGGGRRGHVRGPVRVADLDAFSNAVVEITPARARRSATWRSRNGGAA